MRHHLTAVGATLTACGVLVGTALHVAAATPQTAPATDALRYLYAQVGSDGSIAGALGPTEDTVISVADGGYDPATLRNASSGTTTYAYLAAHRGSITTAGGVAKFILAWVAAGKPAAIDATALVLQLNTPTTGGGYLAANGSFHSANPAIETPNAFTQSLAVLADVAAGHALPPQATGWLACAQRPDGGFGYAIDASAAAPPTFCGDSSSDTNDTAIVLQALGSGGVTGPDAAADAYLHAAQASNGGFGFSSGSSTDPDSDATVIQGLVAIGQDPTAATWSKGTANAMSDLLTFIDPHGSGGFVFPGNTGPDAFTTSAIPQALLLDPYGAPTTITAGTAPPPPATPSPSPRAGVPVPSTGATGASGFPAGTLLVLAGAVVAATGIRRARPGAQP